MTVVKRCVKCNKLKAASAFHKTARAADGLYAWCILCKKTHRPRVFGRAHIIDEKGVTFCKLKGYELPDSAFDRVQEITKKGPCANCLKAFEAHVFKINNPRGFQ